MELVSIIVPIYNTERWLEFCIKSILAQTYKNLQIILVNDGSLDNSGDVCDLYASLDSRIEVIHKIHEGVSGARNEGICKAAGKYIHFVDSDDTIDNNMIERLYTEMVNGKADLVFCGYNKIIKTSNINESINKVVCEPYTGNIKEFLPNINLYLIKALIQGPCWKLYKTSIIKKNKILFPICLSFSEDTLFVYKYLSNCYQIIAVDNCLYNYIYRKNNSLSSTLRADKLDIYLHSYDILNELLMKFNVEINGGNDVMIGRLICDTFVSCMKELYEPEFNIKRKNRYKLIDAMMENSVILEKYKKYGNYNRQSLLIKYYIKTKDHKSLDLYFYMKEQIRRNFYWLFKVFSFLNKW